MIVGNPDKFAIIIDVVDDWNDDDTFNNGIMFFLINSIVFPQELYNITLNVNVRHIYKSLQNIGTDSKIFSKEKEDAFKTLYKLVYPRDLSIDNDYRFRISPYEFNDRHNLVFAVGDGENIRILASNLKYDIEESICLLENIDVVETFIKLEDLNKMINAIERGKMKKFI